MVTGSIAALGGATFRLTDAGAGGLLLARETQANHPMLVTMASPITVRVSTL